MQALVVELSTMIINHAKLPSWLYSSNAFRGLNPIWLLVFLFFLWSSFKAERSFNCFTCCGIFVFLWITQFNVIHSTLGQLLHLSAWDVYSALLLLALPNVPCACNK